LGGAKNRAIEASAKALLNRKFEHLGQVTRLEIDPGRKTLFVEAQLKGEPGPVWARVTAYEVERSGEEVFVVVRGLEASREWMVAAANEFLLGRRVKVPDALRFAL
jgi:hypothetical protein